MIARKVFSGIAAAVLAFSLMSCDDDGDADIDTPDVEAPDVDVDDGGDDDDG